MKILFIADIHIKLGQKGVPHQWARDRYRMLWAKLNDLKIDHKVEYIVYGGDIFDRVPSMEELEVFYEMLETNCNTAQVLYSGNHEATSKYGTFLSHLKTAVGPFNGRIVDEFTKDIFPGCDILPYNELKKSHWHNDSGNNILFTHVRGEIPPHVKPEVDLELFKPWEIVLAGDLHAHSNSQKNILYPGSPITTTFHRGVSEGENGAFIIDTVGYTTTFIPLDLPQLLRKTVTSKDEMIATDYHHTIYELVGDIVDLKQIENSDLLDKKITKKTSQATLQLKNMTIEEELFEYLIEVAGVADPQAIIQEYYDSIKTTNVG